MCVYISALSNKEPVEKKIIVFALNLDGTVDSVGYLAVCSFARQFSKIANFTANRNNGRV